MKRLILAIIMVLALAVFAEAKVDTCLWVWNVDIGGATADAPDEVHCSVDGNPYVSAGVGYAQNSIGAKSVTVTVDTVTPNGSATTASLVASGTATVIPQNANVINANIHAGATCATLSAGGVYYYAETAIADADVVTFELTPPPCFKVTITDTNDVGIGSAIVWTTVVW